ncbi:MAG: PAS domain S-box protein [Deltaproteobacteria bacterium]|nr:PAS domain S-box protein [Deltaproteobacteria bacterium]
MRLVNKIWLGYGVVLLALLLVLVGFRYNSSIHGNYRQAAERNLQINETLADLKVAGLRIVTSTNEAVVIQLEQPKNAARPGSALDEEKRVFDQGIAPFRAALQRYDNYVGLWHRHERPIFQEIQSSGEKLIQVNAEYASLVTKESPAEVILKAKKDSEEAEQKFLAAVDAAIARHQGEFLQQKREMELRAARYFYVVLICCLFLFLVVLSAGRTIAKRISRPIEELRMAALQIGRGELDVRVEVRGRDEIGLLGETFNRMASDLKLFRDALRESGEFARTVLNSVPDAISIIDPADYTIVGVNRVFLQESGRTEEDVIGKPCHLVTHGTSEPCTAFHKECPLREVMKTGEHVVFEHTHGEGEQGRTVEVAASPIRDEEGKIVRIVHVSRDITERKQTEQELLEKHLELQEMYRMVEGSRREWEVTMDALGEMIILIDGEEKVRRYNRAFRLFTGLSGEELDGAGWNRFLTNTDIRVGTVFGEGGMEFFHLPTKQWFVLNSSPYKDPESGLSGTVITIHNSTELKYMADELEEINRRVEKERTELQSALDQLSALIHGVIREKNFNTRFSNPHMVRCHEVKNCTQKNCPCYGKDANRCWQVAGTFCGGEAQGEFAKKIKNCEECAVYQVATDDPIYRIGENFNNMMHILQVKNRELEQAYADLKSTQSQILQSEKMASIGQLAAGVAHEINNPMGFITSNLGTLEKYVGKLSEFIEAQSAFLKEAALPDVLTEIDEMWKKLKLDYVLEDIPELIEESLEGAERVKKIVQNLKSFSRVDQAECKMADLHDCLESTLNIVWNELKYKCTVTKEYGEIPRTQCHPQELNQVFMNLLVNAAQSIEKQGRITIRTESDAGMIRVKISDTGSGIPQDKLKRIFEPFFTTKEVGKGTGLGLSICYDIVKKHGGEIDVTSEVGKGTTFTVSIPVVAGKEMERVRAKEGVYG